MSDLVAPDRQRCLNNRYTVGGKLGTGGLSAVFEATDGYADYYGDPRPLAVKLPLEHLSDKSDVDAFMYAEYSHLARLSHPNIIKAIDFGIDSHYNLPYLVLERMEGKLLKDASLPALSGKHKNEITSALFDAVHYLHSRQIVHADIAPANIMLLDDGSLRLFDFGISVNTAIKHPFELDYSTVKAYNPLYAAPEILEGAVPTEKSDLFSLAAVLYELYEHTLPYSESALELKTKPVTFLRMRKIPLTLKYWLYKALSYKPDKREKRFNKIFSNSK